MGMGRGGLWGDAGKHGRHSTPPAHPGLVKCSHWCSAVPPVTPPVAAHARLRYQLHTHTLPLTPNSSQQLHIYWLQLGSHDYQPNCSTSQGTW